MTTESKVPAKKTAFDMARQQIHKHRKTATESKTKLCLFYNSCSSHIGDDAVLSNLSAGLPTSRRSTEPVI